MPNMPPQMIQQPYNQINPMPQSAQPLANTTN